MANPPAHRVRRRPGFFYPVILRARRDGWTIAGQCGFLAYLYFTGSVAAAARAVGMTRESAHRLRARDDAASFAAAWDRVLTPPGAGRQPGSRRDFRKVTLETLIRHDEFGLVRPVIYRGKMTAIARKCDNSALLRILRRGDAMAARCPEEAPVRRRRSFSKHGVHRDTGGRLRSTSALPFRNQAVRVAPGIPRGDHR